MLSATCSFFIRFTQSTASKWSKYSLKLYFLLCSLHHRISGGAALDKNIKEHVCAQIEKNFARAKWKV